MSVCESVASTISVEHPSEDDMSTDDDDNGEDNGDDTSDTASAPSPRPPTIPTPPAPSSVQPSVLAQRTMGFVAGMQQHQQRTTEGGYDSSATLSADEGPGGGDASHSQLSPHLRHHVAGHAPPGSQRAVGMHHDRLLTATAPPATSAQRMEVGHGGSGPGGNVRSTSVQPFMSYTDSRPLPHHDRSVPR